MIKDDKSRQEGDLVKVKALIEEKGLKQQVQNLLKNKAAGIKTLGECITDCIDCVSNCTDCVWCDTNCVSSCTSCVTCVSDEVAGHIPGITIPKGK